MLKDKINTILNVVSEKKFMLLGLLNAYFLRDLALSAPIQSA